jgi:hypothetical protein
MEVFYFYASGGQGRSHCTHRIRKADADRLANGARHPLEQSPHLPDTTSL